MSRSLWVYKLKALFFFNVAYAFFYLLPNFFPLSNPLFLPLTQLDKSVPFLPWTFAIYLSDYILVGSVLFFLTNKERLVSFIRMCFGGLFICGLVFLSFPTAYPRPPYPTDVSWLVRSLMWLVSTADTPNNCFPSMHVMMTGISAWSIRDYAKKKFFLYLFWSGAIFVSTLTTKQHYALDIFGGVLVIILVAFLETNNFLWWVPLPKLEEASRPSG